MTCCEIWSGIVSYGLGADNSLPNCNGIQMIARGQVAAGISDPWAEISGIIVMVRRSGNKSRGTATGFFFSVVCLLFFSLACFSFPTEATRGHCNLMLPRQSSLHQHHKGLTGILSVFIRSESNFSSVVISTLYKTEWLRQD